MKERKKCTFRRDRYTDSLLLLYYMILEAKTVLALKCHFILLCININISCIRYCERYNVVHKDLKLFSDYNPF